MRLNLIGLRLNLIGGGPYTGMLDQYFLLGPPIAIVQRPLHQTSVHPMFAFYTIANGGPSKKFWSNIPV